MAALHMVACPRCGTGIPYSAANPFRPFCSERCKLIDLGAWANKEYRAEVRNDTGQDRDEGQAEA